MSFGSLATLLSTSVATNQVLYTAPTDTLVEGKVYVTNKSSAPIRFRVGLSTGGLESFNSSGYLTYERELAVGEYFESADLYFSDGQSLIVRSTDNSTFFNLLGKETPNPLNAGFVASLTPTDTSTNQLLYIVPDNYKKINASLFICNKNAFPVDVRVTVGASTLDYIEYNYRVQPRETHQRTEIRAFSGETIRCKTTDLNTNFVLSGHFEDYSYFYGNVGVGSTVSATSYVGQNYYVSNSIGVGVSNTAYKLEVVGRTKVGELEIGGNLKISGVSTFVGGVTFEGGTINFGDSQIDNIVLNAQVDSNVVPTADDTYDLGTSANQWRNLYVTGFADLDDLIVSGIATIGNRVIVGGASTALVSNGDIVIKGEVGIGTTTQKQIRYNQTKDWVEIYNKSLSSWMPILGVDNTHVTVNSNYNSNSFETIWVDTETGGAFTVFLPSSPNVGDKIKIYDLNRYFDQSNLNVNRNGKLIMGDAEDLVLSTQGASFELTYSGNSRGWLIFPV
jgi:hypothetical protein